MIAQPMEGVEMPIFRLATWSLGEFEHAAVAPQLVFARSDRKWVIYDGSDVVFVAGVYAPSLVGSVPELWLLVSADLSTNLRKRLREIEELRDRLLAFYPVLQVKVNKDFTAGIKFARHFGFTLVEELELENGKTYEVMECHLIQ